MADPSSDRPFKSLETSTLKKVCPWLNRVFLADRLVAALKDGPKNLEADGSLA